MPSPSSATRSGFGAADDPSPRSPLPLRRLLVLALAGFVRGAGPRAGRRRPVRGEPRQPGAARRGGTLGRGVRPGLPRDRAAGRHWATTASSSTRSPASRCTSTRSAPDLDRPRYRLQRPLLPWLAWALHPSGGGIGLVYAFLLVGFGALVVGGVSLGAISVSLGGRTWPALAFPLLPGGYVCLRISVADTLSVALALLAIASPSAPAGAPPSWPRCSRCWPRRSRCSSSSGSPSGAATAAAPRWWASRSPPARRGGPALHLLLPDGGGQVDEIVAPFLGLAKSVQIRLEGDDLLGAAAVVVTIVVAVVALAPAGLVAPVRAGRRHPAGVRLRARRQRDRPQPQRPPRHHGPGRRRSSSWWLRPSRTGVPPPSHTRPVT